MKINFKWFLIAIVFVMVVSAACGSTPTPVSATPTYMPTPTLEPTATLQPTYTPYPTYTPFPTPTSTALPPTPTSVPNIDYVAVDCPEGITAPEGVIIKCYALNINPVAVGMVFYSEGQVVAISVAWETSAPESITKKAATFIVVEAQKAGWNMEDLQEISSRLPDASVDETIRVGTLQAVWEKDNGYTSITYGLVSFFGY